MSFRTSLRRLARRDLEKPSLRERAAGLRASLARITRRPEPEASADQSRRAVMGGALAAAMPLPALAATAAVVPQPHPDQALLDLDTAQAAARIKLEAAQDAYRVASDSVNLVLAARPPELLARRQEYQTLTHPFAYSSSRWGVIRFRYAPPGDSPPDLEHWQTQAWTGAGLRRAITRAPFAQGRGGLTPFLIQRLSPCHAVLKIGSQAA